MLCNNGKNGKGWCPALEYVHEQNNFLRAFCTRYSWEMGRDQNYKSEAWEFKWHKIVEGCDGYDRLISMEEGTGICEPIGKPVEFEPAPKIEEVIPEDKPKKKPWYNNIIHPFGG